MYSPIKKLDTEFFVLAIIIVLLWSTPPLVSKLWVGSGIFPGFFFGFLRYIFGAVFLIIIVASQGKVKILFKIFRTKFHEVLFCAFWLSLMILGQNFSILFILGSSSSVLLNFNPTLIYLFAPLLFVDEKYTKRKTIGVVISSIGIGVVFLASLETASALSLTDFIIGNGLGFLSGVGWAGYSLSLKRLFHEKEVQEITALNLFVASIILLTISIITEHFPPIESYSLLSVWGLIVIGIGAAGVAFTLYLMLVQKYGAIHAGNIQFLIPLVSILFAWIYLAEFSRFALIGGILCAFGVALVSFEFSFRSRESTNSTDPSNEYI
ncbi:MAG: DMT family transporter [Candidatus Hodarchaeota archaeon]